MLSDEKLIYFLQKNLISADEAAQQLEIAKSTLMALVKNGEIKAVYQRPKAYVFLQQTITAYKNSKNKLNPAPFRPRFHIENSALHHAIGEIKEALTQMGRIRTIHVYFDENDAALDGFYYMYSGYRSGELESLRSPRMILIDEYGEQLWTHCGTAGYGGTGPHNAADIMRLLPDSGLTQIPPVPEELIQKVFRDRVVKYALDLPSGTWTCFSKDSYMDPRQTDWSPTYEQPLTGRLYSYHGNLILIGGDMYSWSKPELAKEALQRFKEFIPSPVSFIYYPTEELAMKANRFAPDDFERPSNQAFQLIIQDKSGRELWLAPNVEEGKGISRQNSVLELLEIAGFDVSQYQKSTSVFTDWMAALLAHNQEEQPIRGFK